MIDVFVDKDFENKLKKLSKNVQKMINDTLYNMHNENISKLKSIPHSDLFTNKVDGHILILSKKKDSVFIIDIMKDRDFFEEYGKSTFLI